LFLSRQYFGESGEGWGGERGGQSSNYNKYFSLFRPISTSTPIYNADNERKICVKKLTFQFNILKDNKLICVGTLK